MKLKRIVSAVMAGVLAVSTMASTASASYGYGIQFEFENGKWNSDDGSQVKTENLSFGETDLDLPEHDYRYFILSVPKSGHLTVELNSLCDIVYLSIKLPIDEQELPGGTTVELGESYYDSWNDDKMFTSGIWGNKAARFFVPRELYPDGCLSTDDVSANLSSCTLLGYEGRLCWNFRNNEKSSNGIFEMDVEKGDYQITLGWMGRNNKDGSVIDINGTGKVDMNILLDGKVPSSSNSSDVKPTAPTTLKSTPVSPTSAKLTWKSTADSFNIYRATSKSGSYKKIGTSNTASYTDKGLSKGKTYYYKVTAVSGGKESGFSKIVSAKACAPAPTSVKATKSADGKAKLTWKKASGAEGYEIFMATSSGGKFSKIKTLTKGTTVGITKSGLTSGKTYYFKVRSYITVNGKKVYSGYSKTVKVKV